VSLTAQQPYNNVVRTSLQALAAVLGGTQSLHTNALDEALALPTEAAATLALRTQQIIAHETGVADVVDALGGSYYLESLTNRLEEEAVGYIDAIDRMGGMIAAIEHGYPQREIAESAYRFQQAVEAGQQRIVGVNAFAGEQSVEIGTLYIDESAGKRQEARLAGTRRRRDQGRLRQALDRLQGGAGGGANLMALLIDAARADATVGEMCDGLRAVWGEYVEEPII
jgi:methylmalonyl-CoA mutase N-terminal domain/subunit